MDISAEQLLIGTFEVQTIEISNCNDEANELGIRDVSEKCEQQGRYVFCTSKTIEFTTQFEYIESQITKGIDNIGTANRIAESKSGYYISTISDLKICFDGICEEASYQVDEKYLVLIIKKLNGCQEMYRAVRLNH